MRRFSTGFTKIKNENINKEEKKSILKGIIEKLTYLNETKQKLKELVLLKIYI